MFHFLSERTSDENPRHWFKLQINWKQIFIERGRMTWKDYFLRRTSRDPWTWGTHLYFWNKLWIVPPTFSKCFTVIFTFCCFGISPFRFTANRQIFRQKFSSDFSLCLRPRQLSRQLLGLPVLLRTQLPAGPSSPTSSRCSLRTPCLTLKLFLFKK